MDRSFWFIACRQILKKEELDTPVLDVSDHSLTDMPKYGQNLRVPQDCLMGSIVLKIAQHERLGHLHQTKKFPVTSFVLVLF